MTRAVLRVSIVSAASGASTRWVTGGLKTASRGTPEATRPPVTYANNFRYSPYPWATSSATGTKRRDAELMQ